MDLDTNIRSMIRQKSYKFRLYPNFEQKILFEKPLGVHVLFGIKCWQIGLLTMRRLVNL